MSRGEQKHFCSAVHSSNPKVLQSPVLLGGKQPHTFACCQDARVGSSVLPSLLPPWILRSIQVPLRKEAIVLIPRTKPSSPKSCVIQLLLARCSRIPLATTSSTSPGFPHLRKATPSEALIMQGKSFPGNSEQRMHPTALLNKMLVSLPEMPNVLGHLPCLRSCCLLSGIKQELPSSSLSSPLM